MTVYRDGKTLEATIRETGTPRDLISHLLHEIAQKAEWLAWEATRARKVVDALEPEHVNSAAYETAIQAMAAVERAGVSRDLMFQVARDWDSLKKQTASRGG